MSRLSAPVAAAVAAGAVLFSFAVASAQVRTQPREPQGIRVYQGVSDTGEFQQALDRAVAAALRAQPGADRMVRYRVREITGEQGGIAGVNSLRVEIEVSDDRSRGPARDLPPDRGEAPPPRDPVLSDAENAALLRDALRPQLTLLRNRVGRGETVTMELAVRNGSGSTVRVPYLTSQKYEFEVWRGNRLIWRYGQGRAFTQSPSTLTLGPDADVTYRETWNTRTSQNAFAPAGQYEVRAYLPTSVPGVRVGDTAPLTITGR
jgi:hypothetical protein